MTCKHCQAGTHLQHGVHLGECEMHRCEDSSVTQKLALVPMERDTWHQPGKRVQSDAPFTFGGSHYGKR
ncbi:hypothetical protein [Marinobacter sp. MDS2]|uniref:hypothetical protein n=1 Tax=Marinobacter sp. MDS2 TaxID=3065961 RepID=UPI00273A9701|nr:hypothetical protein [Marinobacter sp. MDS2]MDP4546510.1 hypothetical protein [Marinobacter sp. MDS2]